MPAPTILLIEDSVSQAFQFRALLEAAGYAVVVARDGVAGLAQARRLAPSLILLDVNLPALDGFEVLACLKLAPHSAGIPVVMLTGADHVSDVLRAIRLGADDYLAMPDAPYQLAMVVDQLLQPAYAAAR